MFGPTPRQKRPSDVHGTVRPKRLRHSIGPDGSGHITVAVRIRPPNQRESCARCVVRAVDSQMLVFDPDDDVPTAPVRGHLQRQNKNMVFVFDKVFNETASNKQVFENTTQPMLEKLLEGCNCSVFAYGATGSGKTFTMLGTTEYHGVIFHTVLDLYERLEMLKDERSFKITVSYFEVYNENVNDLLKSGSAPLLLLEDPVRGVMISKLSVHTPQNAEQLIEMLHQGNRNRTQHPTDANAESSRSHAVFQVYLTQTEHVTGTSAGVRTSKMSFIDLAGSERAASVTSTGARFREGTNINRSLLALGNCINALADYRRKGHVPFRDSKLTRILKDSLGGKCQTVMIAAVSPSSSNYEDTYNTLKYADRAKNIRIEVKRNMVNVDFHISMYGAVLEEYKKKNDELSTRLKQSEVTIKELRDQMSELRRQLENAAPPSVPVLPSKKVPGVPESISQDIKKLYEIRSGLLKEFYDCDCSLRSMELKTRLRDMTFQNCSSLLAVPEVSGDRPEASSKSLEARRQQLAKKKIQLHQKLQENQSLIAELVKASSSVCSPQDIDREVEQQHFALALEESQYRESTMMQACLMQAQQISQWDQMHQVVLPHIRDLHLLAEGHKYLTKDLQAAYQHILSLAKRSSRVCWADQRDEEPSRFLLKDLLDIPRLHGKPVKPCSTGDMEQPTSPGADCTTFVAPRDASPHPVKFGRAAYSKVAADTPNLELHVFTPARAPHREGVDPITPVKLDLTFDASTSRPTVLRQSNWQLEESFVSAGHGSPMLNAADATFMVNGTPKKMGGQTHDLHYEKPHFVPPPYTGPMCTKSKENVPRFGAATGQYRQQRGGPLRHPRPWRTDMRRTVSASILRAPHFQEPVPPRHCRPTWNKPQSYRGRGRYFW